MDAQSIRTFVLRELGKEKLRRIIRTLTESPDPALQITRDMAPKEVEKRLLIYICQSGLVHSLTEKYFGSAFDKDAVKEEYHMHRARQRNDDHMGDENSGEISDIRATRREQAKQYSESLRGAPIDPNNSTVVVRHPSFNLGDFHAADGHIRSAEQYLEVIISAYDILTPRLADNGAANTTEDGVFIIVLVLGHLRHAFLPIACAAGDLNVNMASIVRKKVRFCVSQGTLTVIQALNALSPCGLSVLVLFNGYSGTRYVYAQGRLGLLEFFTKTVGSETPFMGTVTVPLSRYGCASSLASSSTDKNAQSIGSVTLSLMFVPFLTSSDASMEESMRRAREILVTDKKIVASALAEYDRTASTYMRDYLGSQPRSIGLERRFIQLHALCDDGRVAPISSLVVPFISSLLPTISYCTRFVQLLSSSMQPTKVVTVPAVEQNQLVWSRIMTTLSAGAGTPFDKAILLCSMLRGYQVPAFVALGTCNLSKVQGVSRAGTSAGAQSVRTAFVIAFCAQIVQFWDLSASDCNSMIELRALGREGHYELNTEHDAAGAVATVFPFETVDCLFNETMLLCNIQSTNRLQYIPERGLVHGISLDISKPLFWKQFSTEVLERTYRAFLYHKDTTTMASSACSYSYSHILANANILLHFDASLSAAISTNLTEDIWKHIEIRRQSLGLSTPKSDQFSVLLAPTIASWEQTRLVGNAVGQLWNKTFKVALKNYIRPGETLIVYPLQVTGSLKFHASSIVSTLSASDKCRTIIEAHGDKLRLGLWVSVFGYAETVAAVWVIIGCCYVPVS